MINFYGTGAITSYKTKSGKSPYFLVSIQDNTSTTISLKVPYSLKSLVKENERLCFEGYLNEDGIVEVEKLSRAHLEPTGFNFVSNNENIYSFSNKGLILKVDVKSPKFNLSHKTFEFLAKAGNTEVLKRLIGVLNEGKVSLKGIFRNNVGMITSLEKGGFTKL